MGNQIQIPKNIDNENIDNIMIIQGMVDGSASKPALRQDLVIWLRKLTLI